MVAPSTVKETRASRLNVKVLAVFVFTFLSLASIPLMPFSTSAALAAQVQLAWDPSSGDNIAGYKLYYGTSSRNYSTTLNVGKVTTYTITNLHAGHTYYIAATAYNTAGNESAFSDEVHISFPANLVPVAENGTLITMQNAHANSVLRASDQNGHALTYRIASNGHKGSAVIINPNIGSYTYIPNHNSTGTDTFTFVANNGSSDSKEATIKVTITPNSSTAYEIAKDRSISRWTVIDKKPSGGVVRNVYDKKHRSRVIELKGNGTKNAYRLRNADGSKWHDSTKLVLQWSMSYSEPFKLYVDVQTTAGQRFITYTSATADRLGNGRYLYFGIGSGAILGQWHTFTRDLQADIERAQPDVRVVEVNGILIRGNLRIDDIKLLEHLPCVDSDADGICDDDEVYVYGTDPLKDDSSDCGISDGYKLDYLGPHWNADADGDGTINLLDDDMDNDGFPDGYEIAHGSDPVNNQSTPPPPGG